MRVAIVGASGVGYHHAAWWALEGAEVCAFAGTSEARNADTAARLRQNCGFSGRAYTSVQAMLAEAEPDAVDVCSPPLMHYDHAREALRHGCHVLCEKPFVISEDRSLEDSLERAGDLIGLAAGNGLALAVNTQYARGIEALRLSHPEIGLAAPLTSFRANFQTPARERAPDPVRVWIDLAPHPLSMLLALEANAEPDWESLGLHVDGYGVRAVLKLEAAGRTIECDITTRNTPETAERVRFLEHNGTPLNLSGRHGDDGVYYATATWPGGVVATEDFMRLLIRDFIAGRAGAGMAVQRRNLEWMLRIVEAIEEEML